MEKQLLSYENYARNVRRLSLHAGVWPGHVASRIFRSVMPVLHIMTGTIAGTSLMYFVVNNATNLNLVTQSLGISVGSYTIVMKLIVFKIYQSELVELHEQLEMEFRKDLENPKHRAILLSPLKYFYMPMVSLTLFTFGLMAMYNINCVISILIRVTHGLEFRRRTPLPSQWPFPDNNFFYVARYGVELAACYAMGTVSASVDALFGYYVFQMASQFRVISFRMHNLTVNDDYRTVIRECIERREFLGRCRDKLQTIYAPIVLWILMTSAIITCTNIFQASKVGPAKSLIFFIYVTTKLLQALLYGWYGLFLTTESEAFQESIYCSGWPGCGDKLFLLNVLTMSMGKPLALKACQFSTISLDMFMAIANTTLSYFFLLRTLDEK